MLTVQDIYRKKKSKNEKCVFKWNVCFIAIYRILEVKFFSLKIDLMTQQRHTKKKVNDTITNHIIFVWSFKYIVK